MLLFYKEDQLQLFSLVVGWQKTEEKKMKKKQLLKHPDFSWTQRAQKLCVLEFRHEATSKDKYVRPYVLYLTELVEHRYDIL